ncbi:uncharacterized protein C8Q71DRAFT_767871 [Rhodofomes roseus]|uniref:Uncharacterized protein n=1 Tax=Rhodofomes roseus TaxID=34475 RepID=A0ABQ8KCN8_9APHY|nr:uncharacterized protein C8Q71DRAFT_767871 [Rhodofomes roseus]KAH9834969.1 hypothetical protein C8Q71DRAFT_767871 [Rhodofomes roseus]
MQNTYRLAPRRAVRAEGFAGACSIVRASRARRTGTKVSVVSTYVAYRPFDVHVVFRRVELRGVAVSCRSGGDRGAARRSYGHRGRADAFARAPISGYIPASFSRRLLILAFLSFNHRLYSAPVRSPTVLGSSRLLRTPGVRLESARRVVMDVWVRYGVRCGGTTDTGRESWPYPGPEMGIRRAKSVRTGVCTVFCYVQSVVPRHVRCTKPCRTGW